jgi:small-conductance mechanosensitive channel
VRAVPLHDAISKASQKADAFGEKLELPVRELIVGLILVAVAFGITTLVKLWIDRVMRRHREAGTLEPESSTRLLMSRRLLSAVIWLFAIAAALGQFPHLRVLSAGLLASAGLSGLVVGFAARSTLGNAIAGVTIAFAQPLRIGDDVEFRTDRGVVEDITLLYTVLRLADLKRLVIPNDVLQSEVIKNLTMGQAGRVARPEVLVAPRADATAVRQAMLAEALAFPGLDKQAAAPEVLWVRIDERGILVRLVASCATQADADQLAQRVLGRAAQLVSQPQV